MTSYCYKFKRWQYYDMAVLKLKNISNSVSKPKQIIVKWVWFCISSNNKLQKSATWDSLRPNYLRYKLHKRWLLSWIHFIVIIRVMTFLNALKCRWSLTWHQYRSAINKGTSIFAQDWLFGEKCHGKCLRRCSFPFRKQAMPFLPHLQIFFSYQQIFLFLNEIRENLKVST